MRKRTGRAGGETDLERDTNGEDEAGYDDAHFTTSHVCDRGRGQGAKDSADGENGDDKRLLRGGDCTRGI